MYILFLALRCLTTEWIAGLSLCGQYDKMQNNNSIEFNIYGPRLRPF